MSGTGGTVAASTSGSSIYIATSGTGGTQTYTWSSSPYATVVGGSSSIWNNTSVLNSNAYTLNDNYVINEGQELKITMPNGAILTVNKDGSYEMVDDGKITYKGCKIREFNRFINASDLLEEFIIFMGKKFNVRQGEVLQIPIELFINWLIIKACTEDGDEIPQDILRIEDHSFVKKTKILPRCKCCGRFISRKYIDNSILFCNSRCMDKLINYKLGVEDGRGLRAQTREQHDAQSYI